MTPTFNFTITREWLGGSESIDLSTTEGWLYFANDVTQDYDAAEEVATRIRDEGEVIINESQPKYTERYTKVEQQQGEQP